MYRAGIRSGRLVDESRRSWTDDGPRPLPWTAWYPVEGSAGEYERPRQAGASEAERLFSLGALVPDGELARAEAPLPVVLVSHGTGGSAADLSWLGRRLACAGYVVLGVSHHGNTSLEPYRPEGFLCWWERARDLSSLLDQLERRGPFAGRLDLAQVYAFGFSLGGYTVMSLLGGITDTGLFRAWGAGRSALASGPKEFPDVAAHIGPLLRSSAVFRASWERQGQSYLDGRVRAAFLAAPAPPVRALELESIVCIRTPIAMVVGDADQEAPPEECARWLQTHLPNASLDSLGEAVGHYVFLCECTELGRARAPELCVDPAGVDRAAIHADVAQRVLRHFEEHASTA